MFLNRNQDDQKVETSSTSVITIQSFEVIQSEMSMNVQSSEPANQSSLFDKYNHNCSRLKELSKQVIGGKILEFQSKQVCSKLKRRHKNFSTLNGNIILNNEKNKLQLLKKQQNIIENFHKTSENSWQNILKDKTDSITNIEFSTEKDDMKRQINFVNTIRKSFIKQKNDQYQHQIVESCSSIETQPKKDPKNSNTVTKAEIQKYRRIFEQSQRYLQKQNVSFSKKNIMQDGRSHNTQNKQNDCCFTLAKTKNLKSTNLQRKNKKDNLHTQTITDANILNIDKHCAQNWKNISDINKQHINQNFSWRNNKSVSKQHLRIPQINQYKLQLCQSNTKHIQFSDLHLNFQPQYILKKQCFIQNSSVDSHQYQSQNINTQNLSQCLQTRVGIPQRQGYHTKTQSMPVSLMQSINNQLDLGLKIIDDSFEISAIDEHAGSHQLWINGSSAAGSGNSDWSAVNLNIKHAQQIILQQSIVSPQCQNLRQKLDCILNDDGESKQFELPILKIPLLQLNNCYSKAYEQPYLSRKYNNNCIKIIEKHEKVILLNIGLLVDTISYSLNRNDYQRLCNLHFLLQNLTNCPYNSIITNIYGYQTTQNHEQQIITIYKQPLNIIGRSYKINELTSQIEGQNLKMIIRQFLTVMTYLHKNACRCIKLSLQQILFEQYPVLQNKSTNLGNLTIKIDFCLPDHLNSIKQTQCNNICSNLNLLLSILQILKPLTSITADLQAQYQNFIFMIIEGSKLQSENIEQYFYTEICMHPFIFQCFKNLNILSLY